MRQGHRLIPRVLLPPDLVNHTVEILKILGNSWGVHQFPHLNKDGFILLPIADYVQRHQVVHNRGVYEDPLHARATTLYHQTRDLLYVQRFLGHRSISNTMLYIQIEEALFGAEADQYVCKVARTVEDALPLLEQGFTEASDFDGVKIYRKPKNLVH